MNGSQLGGRWVGGCGACGSRYGRGGRVVADIVRGAGTVATRSTLPVPAHLLLTCSLAPTKLVFMSSYDCLRVHVRRRTVGSRTVVHPNRCCSFLSVRLYDDLLTFLPRISDYTVLPGYWYSYHLIPARLRRRAGGDWPVRVRVVQVKVLIRVLYLNALPTRVLRVLVPRYL